MKKVRNMKRPFAVAILSLTLFQFSAQSAVAVGTYSNARTYVSANEQQMQAAIGWAAIAAGVAVVGAAVGAVVGAYEVGTIVGHAAHDLFGSQAEISYDFERANYTASDFSEFDNTAVN
ncbi:hypothetical protein [Hymenobacter swuensis]|uniref:Uncharacterized protein n=1 Tax=Hymenobacter swuensis DY53 TaxID=1227739 RepID=W8F682_9BACT|nr:hypothetical protein [Hymenobacter swuensis]AHJ98126.1 hypothetical protein Hsw_2531 [Hymenobacter swuensis DY53]